MLGTILALDHSAVTGGYALNVKINPTLVKSDEGRKALRTLIDGYISDGGPQVQFNFVDAETLKKANRSRASTATSSCVSAATANTCQPRQRPAG